MESLAETNRSSCEPTASLIFKIYIWKLSFKQQKERKWFLFINRSNKKRGLIMLSMNVMLKVCAMGPWFVLVSPCFGENVVAICKIGSFLCSFDNLLQKNVIVLFFGNQISKWRSFEKRAILTYFSHCLVTREKLQKFLQHISHSHTYTYFAHPIDIFCLTNFIRYGFSLVWVLVLILIRAILEQSINNKMVSKI